MARQQATAPAAIDTSGTPPRKLSDWSIAGRALEKLSGIDEEEAFELRDFPANVKAKHAKRREAVTSKLTPAQMAIVERQRAGRDDEAAP
jgi:hypothetical protein